MRKFITLTTFDKLGNKTWSNTKCFFPFYDEDEMPPGLWYPIDCHILSIISDLGHINAGRALHGTDSDLLPIYHIEMPGLYLHIFHEQLTKYKYRKKYE